LFVAICAGAVSCTAFILLAILHFEGIITAASDRIGKVKSGFLGDREARDL
jgi:hypothetical protein